MINITYHKQSGRFRIECPLWANDRVRKLPSYRFDRKTKQWTAPAIRANIRAMNEHLIPGPGVTYSPEALAVVNEANNDRSRDTREPFPPWYKFKREPRLAQKRAFERCYGRQNVALFMDMRTGKTKALIDMVCALRMEGKIDHMLLLCPINIRHNWCLELENDATIPYSAHILTTKDKGKKFWEWISEPHDFKILMVGTESLASGSAHVFCEKFLASCSSPVVAVDESQMIKTHDAVRTERVIALRKYAKYRYIMTGTSMSKGPMDLYSQFEFLDPDIIGCGDFYSFRNRYAIMGGHNNKEIIGYTNQEELMDLIAPYVYQVEQKDAIDVPPKTYEVITVPMTPEQAQLYKDFRKHRHLSTDQGSLTVEMAMQTIQRLHEIAGGHYTTEIPKEQYEELKASGVKVNRFTNHRIEGPQPKINECLNLTNTLAGSIIFWCAYKSEVADLVAMLKKVHGPGSTVEIHGDVSLEERRVSVARFQAGEARFLVGNAETGGVGLTLSKAETIVYYSNTFPLLARMQSEERATGGTPVLVIDLMTEGSVDFLVRRALMEKTDLTQYVRNQINQRVPFHKITDD